MSFNWNYRKTAVLLGLFAATIVSTATMLAHDSVFFTASKNSWDETPILISDRFVFFLSMATVPFLHALLLGLPAYLLFSRKGYTQWWISIVAGFVIGYLPFTLMISLNEKPDFTVSFPLGFYGAAGGFSAWITWRWWLKRNIGNGNVTIKQ